MEVRVICTRSPGTVRGRSMPAEMGYDSIMNGSRRPIAVAFLIAAVLLMQVGSIPASQADEGPVRQYPETVSVLQELYGNEIRAGCRYQLYSDAAMKDGYRNIAHLFKALAVSEAVHARQFKRILASLGVQARAVDLSGIKASGTKKNLKHATEVELAEIDKEYPNYLRRIGPEGHEDAMKYVNYAWLSERQHRDLIKKIQSGTGMFFHMLVKYFYENDSLYYVNENCGSTVVALPAGQCPICHMPVDTYREVPRP